MPFLTYTSSAISVCQRLVKKIARRQAQACVDTCAAERQLLCLCCSNQELRERLEALQEQLGASAAATQRLQAQHTAQQAHWEGVVHNLQARPRLWLSCIHVLAKGYCAT